MIKHTMHFNQDREQWYVDLQGRDYTLSCGESFDIYIGNKAVPCRLELADKWYVIMDNVSFDLRENHQYQINL